MREIEAFKEEPSGTSREKNTRKSSLHEITDSTV